MNTVVLKLRATPQAGASIVLEIQVIMGVTPITLEQDVVHTVGHGTARAGGCQPVFRPGDDPIVALAPRHWSAPSPFGTAAAA
jgi:hypothetical protein